MTKRIKVLELRSVRGTGGGPEKTIMFGAAQADRSRFDITVCYIRDARDEVYQLDSTATKLPIDYVEVRERNSFDPQILAATAAHRARTGHRHRARARVQDRCDRVAPGPPGRRCAAGHRACLDWRYCARTIRVLSSGQAAAGEVSARHRGVEPDQRRAHPVTAPWPIRVTVMLNGIDSSRVQAGLGRA
jgi:hypothetical protein